MATMVKLLGWLPDPNAKYYPVDALYVLRSLPSKCILFEQSSTEKPSSQDILILKGHCRAIIQYLVGNLELSLLALWVDKTRAASATAQMGSTAIPISYFFSKNTKLVCRPTPGGDQPSGQQKQGLANVLLAFEHILEPYGKKRMRSTNWGVDQELAELELMTTKCIGPMPLEGRRGKSVSFPMGPLANGLRMFLM